MKEVVHAAAVQMDVKRELEANLATMGRAVEALASTGPLDLVVFPELANSGYLRGGDKSFARDYLLLAEKVPGVFTHSLGEMAKRHHIYIVTGMLQAHPVVPGSVYNSGVVIGPAGEVLGIHHKMHIPGQEKHFFYPGNTLDVYRTELGVLGVMVCADSSFPELARMLALKGAEILCIAFNSSRKSYESAVPGSVWRTTVRAFENQVFAVGCNRVGDEGHGVSFPGGTCISSPDGAVLAEAGLEREDMLRAALSADVLKRERATRPLLSERRPDLYQIITQKY